MTLFSSYRVYLPYFLLAAAAVFWGGAFVAGKYVVGELSPLAVSAHRFILAWVFMAAFLVYRERRVWLPLRDVPFFVLLGLAGAALPNALMFYGLKYTSAMNGSLIQGGNPVASALLAALILGERMAARQWVGVLFSVIGVVYVITEGSLRVLMGFDLNLGNILMAGSMLSWAFNGVLSKIALDRYSPLAVATHTIFFGGVFLVLASLWEGSFSVGGVSFLGGVSLVYLALFGNFLGQVWWLEGINSVGVSRSAVFLNLIPVSALALSALILGEKLVISHVVGAVLVISGVYLTARPAGGAGPIPSAKGGLFSLIKPRGGR